jgi:hypothetical protein
MQHCPWRRYTDTFYQYARPAPAKAVAAGHVGTPCGVYPEAGTSGQWG